MFATSPDLRVYNHPRRDFHIYRWGDFHISGCEWVRFVSASGDVSLCDGTILLTASKSGSVGDRSARGKCLTAR